MDTRRCEKTDSIRVENSDHWLCVLFRHYPDLPRFAFHPAFRKFCIAWLQFQRCIAMADRPDATPVLDRELQIIAVELHNLVVDIFHKTPQHYLPEDCESSTPYMIAAVQTLKERIDVMQQLLRLLDTGRLLGKDVLATLHPLFQHIIALRHQQRTIANRSLLDPCYVNPAALASSWSSPTHSPQPLPPAHPQPAHPPPPPTPSEPLATLPSPPQSVTPPQHRHHPPRPCRTPDHCHHSPIDPTRTNKDRETPASADEGEETMDDDNDTDTDYREEEESAEDESEEDPMDEDDDYVEPEAKASSRRRRSTARTKASAEQGTIVKRTRAPRQYTRRTATSYDAETTHYLKSVFFSIYSKRDKLTKDQRRQVQLHTGLKPRNITYWFSNHKRRFQTSLYVFKETARLSKGAVKTYDDFLKWRQDHGLPEEVLESELDDIPGYDPLSSLENDSALSA